MGWIRRSLSHFLHDRRESGLRFSVHGVLLTGQSVKGRELHLPAHCRDIDARAGADGVAVGHHLTGIGFDQPHQQSRGGGLAAARLAHDAERLAFAHDEGYLVHGVHCCVTAVDAPQAPIVYALLYMVNGFEKIDYKTVAITTSYPFTFLPSILTRILMASPAQWGKVGKSWPAFAKAPSGIVPFKITRVVYDQYVEMVRNELYWDKTRVPKLDKLA